MIRISTGTFVIIVLIKITLAAVAKRDACAKIPLSACCTAHWPSYCTQLHCLSTILQKCPSRKEMVGKVSIAKPNNGRDLRRAPQKTVDEPKCGTTQMNYYPCTSKSIANKLFRSCCELYVPAECQFICEYETEQNKAKEMFIYMTRSKCSFKYLSSILYCASQNRDNRQCCRDLDLNAPQLMVGSRCLRMCDPSGTSIGQITKEDVTCLFNWNVIMYCHHSGIREM